MVSRSQNMVEKLEKMIFIVRFNEIFLKGKNQGFFINKLKENIIRVCPDAKIERIPGGLEIQSQDDFLSKIRYIFGIANAAQVKKIKADIEILKRGALELMLSFCEYETKRIPTFALHSTRSDKQYPLNSLQINQEIGDYIHERTGFKVNLKQPDIRIFIDILAKDRAYLYLEKISGPGGLPAGSSAPVLSLISSGFDSPIASYLLIKRGARCMFLHFHSYPFSTDRSIRNVKKIVTKLSKYQGLTKLYMAPLGEIQKELLTYAPKRYLVILYRRIMLRVAERIAHSTNIKALLTGENLGQVASQTIENMAVISRATSLPILRPLVGFDKQEIIHLAEKIGTASISKLPYDDCCLRFVPRHPETRARLEDVEKIEKDLSVPEYIKRILSKTKIDMI